ncbi:MAG: hypothetical protein OEV49_04775 [candidate division Zixibacteria bacterium]|nr:hypothetical protein [candidate division Zixibacteria bacterium]MDH3938476.1 hypothetical protein [candidate division Zixibacteria bacterium]MDH4032422.1 hypothetical protein [candidate division Zixibacteria bacterium]
MSEDNTKVPYTGEPVIRAQHTDWRVWQVVLPLGVLLMVYFDQSFIVDSRHPVLKVFAQGDLLLFSSMLLFGVSVHLRQVQLRLPHFFKLNSPAEYSRMVAILILMVFGFIKHDVLTKEYFCNEATLGLSKLYLYLVANLVAVLASVSYTVYTFAKVTQKQLQEDSDG